MDNSQQGVPLFPPDEISEEEILSYRGNFCNDKEEEQCRQIVEALTPHEQEVAARTSYVYWRVSTRMAQQGNGGPSEDLRKRTAMKEARRHLGGRTYERAFQSLRDTCKFREVHKLDLLKFCFSCQTSARGIERLNRFLCFLFDLEDDQRCNLVNRPEGRAILSVLYNREDHHENARQFLNKRDLGTLSLLRAEHLDEASQQALHVCMERLRAEGVYDIADADEDDEPSNSLLATGSMSELDREIISLFQLGIEEELQRQKTVVRGYTRDGCPILQRSSRTSHHSPLRLHAAQACMSRGVHDLIASSCFDSLGELLYGLGFVYMAERAMACCEVMSKGREDTIVGMLDYSDQSTAHAVPLRTFTKGISILQKNYPNRVDKVIILDSPFWMRAGFRIISPFLKRRTREKLRFATGSDQKERIVGALVDDDQATPRMLPKGKLTSEVDMHHAIYNVPFHELYDNCPHKSSESMVDLRSLDRANWEKTLEKLKLLESSAPLSQQ